MVKKYWYLVWDMVFIICRRKLYFVSLSFMGSVLVCLAVP